MRKTERIRRVISAGMKFKLDAEEKREGVLR